MVTRYLGAPIPRNEDARLLRGQALFVDDIELPGMLHAAFLRSQVAACSIPGSSISSTNNACPRSNLASSLRGIGAPR